MLYICNFFASNREATSNQIDMLKDRSGANVFAAGKFMQQAHLDPSDLERRRFIVSKEQYEKLLPLVAQTSTQGIHYFAERVEPDKITIFNNSPSGLFVSVYQRPNIELMRMMKKYKRLKAIFVEHESHVSLLLEHGYPRKMIYVAPTPSLFPKTARKKTYNPKRIELLFASWNKGDEKTLDDRGLLHLIAILKRNKQTYLTIPLRDDDTGLFLRLLRQNHLEQRVRLIRMNHYRDVKKLFEQTDYITFFCNRRVTKDIPNSIIDGFAFGKPAIVTDVLDVGLLVKEYQAGIVISPEQAPSLLFSDISSKMYESYSRNASRYAKNHQKSSYIDAIYRVYREHGYA